MWEEFKWNLLLLPEFTSANSRMDFCDGHRVYCRAPESGARLPAIIVHRDLVARVEGEPVSQGKSLGILVDHRSPRLGRVWYVCAHLDHTTSRAAYNDSINDFLAVLKAAPNDAGIICGMDANCNLHGMDEGGVWVGPYTSDLVEHPKVKSRTEWKARRLFQALTHEQLVA
eukprot:11189696-Lingulodinium_polyedra.AAC.1